MKVYVLILQKPLRVKSYTSLTALIEDNNISDLGASKSKLEKWNWSFDYIAHNVVISQTKTLTAGDVRRLNQIASNECEQVYNANLDKKGSWIENEKPLKSAIQ